MLTISQVLRRAGHPVGRCVSQRLNRWRTTCPLHQGDNAEAFSYTTELWHCFTCGDSGGVMGLADRLGIREPPPPPRPAIEGVPDMDVLWRRDPTRVREPPSRRLAREAAEERTRRYADADRIHRACEEAQAGELPRWLDRIAVDYQNDPDGQGAAFEVAARWWAEVQRWRDVAHQLYWLLALDVEVAVDDAALAVAIAEGEVPCPCHGVPWPERGSRVRPRLA